MKKIIALIGTARKKNSLAVTKRFEQELKKLGEYSLEYVFLDDLELKTCIGCHNCLFRGEDKCPLNDNRKELSKKMLSSDGIIFVSPVYVMNITGLMKNMIDRLSYICHRPAFYNQDAMVISTTGALGLKPVLKYLEDVAYVWGFRSVTSLGLTTPPGEEIFTHKNMKTIRKASLGFNRRMNKKTSPRFRQLLQFKFQKKIFDSELGKKISPADYEFYKDRRKYYVPANPIKDFFASMIVKVGMLFMRK